MDFNKWPNFSKTIILLLMMVGACAGSTGGGLKCGRLLILIKSAKRSIRQTMNPNKVEVIRNNGTAVDEKMVAGIKSYFIVYIFIMFISFLLVSIDGQSILTSFLKQKKPAFMLTAAVS